MQYAKLYDKYVNKTHCCAFSSEFYPIDPIVFYLRLLNGKKWFLNHFQKGKPSMKLKPIPYGTENKMN